MARGGRAVAHSRDSSGPAAGPSVEDWYRAALRFRDCPNPATRDQSDARDPGGDRKEYRMPLSTAGQLLPGLAVIVAVAHVLGTVARRLGQPAVIGEILGGILVGPTLFTAL